MHGIHMLPIPVLIKAAQNLQSQLSSMEQERHRKQLAALVGATAVTVLGCIAAKRSVQARRYVPGQFNANHLPPSFNLAKDAAKALVDATVLSTGTFAVAATAAIWYMDLTSIEDFGWRMKLKLGGTFEDLSEKDDESVEAVKQEWSKLFSRK